MKKFKCIINDPNGFDLPTIGLIAREALKLSNNGTTVTIGKDDNLDLYDASNTLYLRILHVKCGDTVTVCIEGGDEDAGVAIMKQCLTQYFDATMEEKSIPRTGKRILVADDAAFMRMMVKDILTKSGYEVAGEAANGKEAVEQYEKLQPDLVLLDITMPEMDGIEALKKIKASYPDALIIMCSAMGQQAMVIEAIQGGAKDFIVKPFQADRVLESVKKVLG